MARPKKVLVEKKAPIVLSEDFVISLKMGNKTITSQGETILDALANLERPTKIFLKGILTVSQGEKKRELLLQPIRIKRLFYPVAQKLVAKQLQIGLK